jgi:hypothetical protein
MLNVLCGTVVRVGNTFNGIPSRISRNSSLTLAIRMVLICLVALSAVGYAGAQVSTAAIHGTVQDTTGAAVPEALVVVKQTETNFTTQVTSAGDGSFNLPVLPVGHYIINVTKQGFTGYEQTGVVLEVGQSVTLPIALKVGQVSETVIVNAAASAVETTSPVIQNVVDQQTVEGLPLNGRNPATLVFTAPGVSDTQQQVPVGANGTNSSTTKSGNANLSAQIAPSANGIAPGGTYFSLDGAGNTDPYNVIGGPFPHPDATQEFAVVTSSYGARYVSAPGGAVNVVTRSGGNQFHGSAFEFIRNGAVNATQYYIPGKDTLKRNQYGFAIGGPFVKDRLFGFVSLQQTATRSQSQIYSYVGTPAQQAGMFTQTATGKVITLPISPVTVNFLKYLPVANANGFYLGSTPLSINEPQAIAKLDYKLGPHRLFARYFTDQVAQIGQPMRNNNLLTATSGLAQAWSNYSLGDTWVSKGGTWVVDARASFIHVKATTPPNPSLAALDGAALGEKVTPATHPTLGLFYAGGLFDQGTIPAKFPRDSYDYNVDVLHQLKKHHLSFGTNLRFVSLNEVQETGQEPSLVFFGTYSKIFYGALDSNTFADLITGHPIIFGQSDGYNSQVKGKLLGFYAEDNYSLSDRLTLTGGLRVDPYKPFTVPNNQIDCFNAGQQSTVYANAPLGLIYPGDPGCNNSGTTGKYGLVQPRVGFAYKADSAGKTAIRGGYGLYASQAQLQSLIGFSAPPFDRSFQLTNPFTTLADPYGSNGLTNPFAAGFQGSTYAPPSNVSFANAVAAGYNASAIDKNYRPAYTEEWSLSIQHAFTPADSVEMAYIGTQSIHVGQTYDANLPVYIPGTSTGTAGSCGSLSGTNLPAAGTACSTTANERARRPYGAEGLLQLRVVRSNATGNYHGVSTVFRHQGRGGLNFYSGFNWSKCIDDGSTPATTGGTTANGSDPSLRRGRCDYDQNLSSRTTVVWNAPNLNDSGRFLRTAAGSWVVSGLFTADAGQPYSVLDSLDNSYTGNSLDRADRVVSQPLYLSNGNLNQAAFTNNAPGTFGNTQRNFLRAPAYVDLDPAVAKTFVLPKEVHFTLRFEGFNVLNHTNKVAPNNQFNSSGNFGTYTSAHTPRILQAAAKFTF